ncbi:hypothetical protein BIV57_07660 [Mangrovactinospora gilvigrisea]|uniref:Uncharacterized protein n=1 Tax=Mangrovactinospora gilvigrisea TaxID=1428644 RepID=A0A1J7BHB1_9ACTN|nr:hypothetical protein [Mangrovactinospora gilvigrisea]OIV38079.1 hypothetical protein BIV57_07660 [Mangrovactinospora gilvigrisea]
MTADAVIHRLPDHALAVAVDPDSQLADLAAELLRREGFTSIKAPGLFTAQDEADSYRLFDHAALALMSAKLTVSNAYLPDLAGTQLQVLTEIAITALGTASSRLLQAEHDAPVQQLIDDLATLQVWSASSGRQVVRAMSEGAVEASGAVLSGWLTAHGAVLELAGDALPNDPYVPAFARPAASMPLTDAALLVRNLHALAASPLRTMQLRIERMAGYAAANLGDSGRAVARQMRLGADIIRTAGPMLRRMEKTLALVAGGAGAAQVERALAATDTGRTAAEPSRGALRSATPFTRAEHNRPRPRP